jgi:glycosyltransferase involved in cell wall biosynthesis
MEASVVTQGCVIIPAYREGGRIGTVVAGVLPYIPHVIVVDDGSPDGTAAEAGGAGAQVIRHAVNLGKGAALDTGFRAARERGFEFVVTMDGDGQHAATDLPAFVEAYRRTGTPVLVGNRMADAGKMPVVRWLTNRFMSWLLSREMGQRVTDTQCGYRLYKLNVVPELSAASKRFAAESEILLELSGKGISIGSVPVATLYGTETSKIHPVKDTLRFIGMLRQHRRQQYQRNK